MMHPSNHKTVFVLDHTPAFGANCESLIEFDFTKARSPGFIPLSPISKSIWTCSVESAIEYCRIVWDLFPVGKLIRFIVSDNKATCLNNWTLSQQCINHLLNGLASVELPPLKSDTEIYSVSCGLQLAVQTMCECSELQHEYRTSLNENTPPVINRCRIICITLAHSIDTVKMIEDTVHQEIIEQNKMASSSDVLIRIDHCELVIMNLIVNAFDSIPSHDVSSVLRSETHCVKASIGLPNKLSSLILQHYNLASTTVIGIPMKEEQNASSSANYDVEILHPAQAHETLFRGCGVDMAGLRTIKEGCEYPTITLKWCTPRGCSPTDMHHCTLMHRITPVDINSRPSSCLVNFLVGGRSVMLEVVRRNGSKVLSHLLASHAGQIYMHSLPVGRSLLEDPPSISEGAGGRVTDYRITDFGLLMQQNKLHPLKTHSQMITPKRTRPRLDRFTKYWPLTISSTVIFNYRQYLEPILSLMLEPELRESDVLQCKQAIFSLIGLEAKHEPLNPPGQQRSKGPKREEQYKQMWAELETFLRAHCVTDKHINVLNCLLEMRSKNSSSMAIEIGDKVELDQALWELEQLTPVNRKEERASVIRATTDSPMSPDANSSSTHKPRHSKSILELWVARFCKTKPRQEFVGLLTAEPTSGGGLKAKLYQNIKEKRKSNRTTIE